MGSKESSDKESYTLSTWRRRRTPSKPTHKIETINLNLKIFALPLDTITMNSAKLHSTNDVKIQMDALHKSMGDARPPRRQSSGLTQLGSWVIGFILLLVVVLLVQFIVIIGMFAGPTLHSVKQFNVILDEVNTVVPEILPMFGAGSSGASDSSSAADNGTDGGMVKDDAAFLGWCQAANLENCDEVVVNIDSGANDAGLPILPIPDSFCTGLHQLNDGLVFCEKSLASNPAPATASRLVAQLDMAVLMCKNFGPVNEGTKNACKDL